jgi:hypothetical protein
MSSPIAEHLADRFASDARALRARADALKAPARPAPGAGPRGAGGRSAARPPGPSAESTLRMADACDRVRALFADVPDDDAARALLPTLAGLVAGARADDERHVYAGAVSRLSDALAGGDDGEDDEDDEDDEEDDR